MTGAERQAATQAQIAHRAQAHKNAYIEYQALIIIMKTHGWEETPAGIHKQGHNSDDDYYDTWTSAIAACIEVAAS